MKYTVRSFDRILALYFSYNNKYRISAKETRLVTLLYEVYELAEHDVSPLMIKLENVVGECPCLFPWKQESLGLDDILIKYFGSGFPLPESPECKSYYRLVHLLYDVGALANEDMEDVICALDEIADENALFDDAGELICDTEEILEELKRRAEEDNEEN